MKSIALVQFRRILMQFSVDRSPSLVTSHPIVTSQFHVCLELVTLIESALIFSAELRRLAWFGI